jgi:hypothetical protein
MKPKRNSSMNYTNLIMSIPVIATVLISIWFVREKLLIAQTQTPQVMIERLCMMDSRGEFVTPEGWFKEASFYLRPALPPKDKVIWVKGFEFRVSKPTITGNKAEVWTSGDVLGPIDSTLRLKGTMVFEQVRGVFNLTLTNSYWKLRNDGKTLEQTNGAFQWRISDDQTNNVYLSLDTAMGYIARLRDETRDPIVKKNADKTIAVLRGYVAKAKR